MAFDWTKVEGYRDDMSAEEKLSLLDNAEQPEAEKNEPATENKPEKAEPAPKTNAQKVEPKPGYVSKREFDKVASDLAAAKRQLRSRMTDDEQREADRQAEIAARDEELKALRREKTLSMHKASFMGLGLAEDLADSAATSLTDNDADGLFDVLRKYQTNYEKALRAKILAETPKPPTGDNPDNQNAERLKKLRMYAGLN